VASKNSSYFWKNVVESSWFIFGSRKTNAWMPQRMNEFSEPLTPSGKEVVLEARDAF
jgi:hypothetical protein